MHATACTLMSRLLGRAPRPAIAAFRSLLLLFLPILTIHPAGIATSAITLDRSVVGSGFIHARTAGYRVIGTYGQPFIGAASAGAVSGQWGYWWWLENSIVSTPAEHPLHGLFALGQNRPNPWSYSTRIDYSLARSGPVRLEIFDVRGALVHVLVDGVQEPGQHTVDWSGINGSGQLAPSGVYYYRLKAGLVSQTRRFVLLR